jgi:hypothetical protein
MQTSKCLGDEVLLFRQSSWSHHGEIFSWQGFKLGVTIINEIKNNLKQCEICD